MSLEKLLIRDQGISVHYKQINTLLAEIYKKFSRESAYFMKFHEKRCNIQSKNIKSLNPTQIFVLYLFSFCASHLWNQLPDHVKYETSVKGFKNKLLKS